MKERNMNELKKEMDEYFQSTNVVDIKNNSSRIRNAINSFVKIIDDQLIYDDNVDEVVNGTLMYFGYAILNLFRRYLESDEVETMIVMSRLVSADEAMEGNWRMYGAAQDDLEERLDEYFTKVVMPRLNQEVKVVDCILRNVSPFSIIMMIDDERRSSMDSTFQLVGVY